MFQRASFFRTTIGCAALMLLAGCLAPPKRHAWQAPDDELPEFRDSASWPQLSTNDYVRVSDSKIAEAVALLQDHPCVQLESSQLSSFAPDLSNHAGLPLLVRGVSFSTKPAYTILRFDAATECLLIQQFTYDSETMMPFRWVSGPNAFVVFLPRAPEHVYPDAVLGGDSIFRGRDWKTLDTR